MTEKRNALSNQLAANASQIAKVDVKTLGPKEQVGYYLEKMMPNIEAILPKHVTAERMSRVALNVIRTNPKLLECNINSLMGAVMESVKLGLEPGMMGQAYLIPFKKKKKVDNQWVEEMECQFIVGYRGLLDLVRRSGQVSTIEAREVYENDEFDYQYGLEDKLHHKPTLRNKGAVIAYYAVAKMKDGGYSFLVMSHEEMEQYRDKYAKSKDYGPWKDEFIAMSKKTALRQLIKYLPISVEQLGNFDEASGLDVHNDVNNAQIVSGGGFVPKTIDGDTGEIIND